MSALHRLALLSVVLAGASFLSACGEATYERPSAVVEAAKLLPAKLDYNWDVRPILSNNCFSCHGNDAAKRKAGLRLDIAENAYAPVPENKSSRAIVPGAPGKSALIHRILSGDPDEQMPPKSTHKVLTPLEIATLEKWVKDGAEYKQHWAYIAPKKVNPGGTPWDKQAVNPIDRYVFAKLRAKGLSPSGEADRETLINRVTLDLIGLPPSLQEVDAFVKDRDPKAYEKLVDRLLASSAYGEKMAESWMDVARYSETDGYLDDHHDRLFSPWRDWAIKAFNTNMPYDRFATWQLAGDLIPNHTREQVLATAFGRLGKRSTENGLIDEEYRVEYRNERSELVGKAFLGLTVGCAKCHDHKYDVISQKEYYSLAGFFNSIDERGLYAPGFVNRAVGPTLDWPTAQQASQLKATKAAIAPKEAALDAAYKAARHDAAGKADALLKQSGAAAGAVKAAIDSATVAYYPLDEAHPGSAEPFKILVRPGARPENVALAAKLRAEKAAAEAAKAASAPAQPSREGKPGLIRVAARAEGSGDAKPAGPRAQRGAAANPQRPGAPPPRARGPRCPNGVVCEDILLTSSGKPGLADAALERPAFVPGVKGRAFLIKDNRGFFPKGVGLYERNDEFSFDLWFKPRAGKVYDDATVVNQMDHNAPTADSGYTLNLEKNYLRFDINHASPANMLSVVTKKPVAAGQWSHVAVTYDGSSRASGIKLYLNGVEQPLEVRKDQLTRTILPAGFGGQLGGDFIGFTFGKRFRAEEFTGGAIDEVRVFGRALTPIEVGYLNDPAIEAGKGGLRARLVELIASKDPRVLQAKTALKQVRDAENQVASSITPILVMGDTAKPRPTYLLDHGLYDAPKDEVKPAGLTRVFKWSPSKYPQNRLGMSKWLFDKKNPLTSRVFVNRLWASHFGNGIVGTVEDFGTQGANPSHPELLDYLAIEFVKSGWDIKHMQRLMVTSATYRQTSTITKVMASTDPQNVWLERGPRYRLPAEVIRDNALAASGLLVRKVGGDSVYPYTPKGMWDITLGGYVYPDGVPADDNHRRSMYSYIKRTSQPPSMAVFDFADRNVSTVSRRISNTPLQALVLLNDPQFVEAYRSLAQRVMMSGAAPEEQVKTVFRLITRRYPDGRELETLKAYRASEAAKYALAPDRSAKLLKVGVAPIDSRIDPAQLAAMTMVAAVIMNSPDAYSIR